jgi:hypothetical protein
MSVAAFYDEFFARLRHLAIDVRIWTMPCEIPDAVAFTDDRAHTAYDADHAQRFWQLLVQSHRVFQTFRAKFVGKASPVHFFWGSFDLAATRSPAAARRPIPARRPTSPTG